MERRLIVRISLIVIVLCAALPGAGFGTPVASAQAGPSAVLSDCPYRLGIGAVAQEITAQCGQIDVPASRDSQMSGGKTLQIRFVVLPARDPNADLAPIFHLEGGPGGSAIEMFGTIWHTAYHDLNADHDIVLIDQRGIGQSTSLQCTEVMDASLTDLAEAPSAEEENRIGLERLQTCLKRLGDEKLDPVDFVSTALADDTNAVREALGYDRINLFGSSYGSWLAQVYMNRHPETVNAVIIEGTVGPWDSPWLRIAGNYDTGIQKLFDLCAADEKCAFTYGDLRARLENALARLENAPARTSGLSSLDGTSHPVVMTRDRLLSVFQAMLNQGPLLGYMPQAISQAEIGVYTLPAAVLVSSAETEISYGMYWSVVCAETVAFYTDEAVNEARTGGYYGLTDSVIDSQIAACKVWRSAEVDLADVAPFTSTLPTLIFSGAFDSQTPPAFAGETAQRLANSTLVSFPYQGHGVMPFSRCAQKLAAQFFAAPGAALDTSCAANDRKPIFNGTYSVDFVPYTDPATGLEFTAPEGWTPVATTADGLQDFAFVENADTLQTMGVARLSNPLRAGDRQAVEAALAAQFGFALAAQADLTSFGTQIVQYAATTENEVLTAALIVVQLPGRTTLIWYAAPGNAFTATFDTIMLKVLPGLLR